MKTDSIFYRLFQEFPSAFFELIGNSPDESESYTFISQEIKQVAFRIDGLFLPKTDEPDKPFYLVEVQFQPDDTLYYRLFSELFLYLKQYRVTHPWQVVVIYPSRNIESVDTIQFREMLALERVKRIYLDELGEEGNNSLGVEVVKLIIEKPNTVANKARAIVEQAKQELTDAAVIRNLIDLIEKIIVYKLPNKSREEIEAMFGLDELKQTRFYQDVQLETKLEAIPKLFKEGLNAQQIARALSLPLEVIEQELQKSQKELEGN